MKILAYKGRSILSKMIQWQTRSKYSHIAIMLDDEKTIIEAWAGDGVCLRTSIDEGHKSGTEIDVFIITAPGLDSHRAEKFLRDQIGKPYDYRSVFRFLSHKSAKDNNKWFCSELALTALAFGFVPLLKGNFSEMSPRDVVMSPLLLQLNETLRTL